MPYLDRVNGDIISISILAFIGDAIVLNIAAGFINQLITNFHGFFKHSFFEDFFNFVITFLRITLSAGA